MSNVIDPVDYHEMFNEIAHGQKIICQKDENGNQDQSRLNALYGAFFRKNEKYQLGHELVLVAQQESSFHYSKLKKVIDVPVSEIKERVVVRSGECYLSLSSVLALMLEKGKLQNEDDVITKLNEYTLKAMPDFKVSTRKLMEANTLQEFVSILFGGAASYENKEIYASPSFPLGKAIQLYNFLLEAFFDKDEKTDYPGKYITVQSVFFTRESQGNPGFVTFMVRKNLSHKLYQSEVRGFASDETEILAYLKNNIEAKEGRDGGCKKYVSKRGSEIHFKSYKKKK